VTSLPWSPSHRCQRLSINQVALAGKTDTYRGELPQGTIHSIACLLKRTKNNCENGIFIYISLISGSKVSHRVNRVYVNMINITNCVLTKRPGMNVLPLKVTGALHPFFERFQCYCRTVYVKATITTFNTVRVS
jgi:hypothetical protein